MPKKTVSKSKTHPKSSKAKFLNNVPYESRFHFCTAIDNYTGITATNLNELAAKLRIVPVDSVDFHFQRKDFQRWISETIGDKELTEGISIIRVARSAEDLRKEIVRIVQERIAELERYFTTNEDTVIKTAVLLQH